MKAINEKVTDLYIEREVERRMQQPVVALPLLEARARKG